jgi:hypothetical protein
LDFIGRPLCYKKKNCISPDIPDNDMEELKDDEQKKKRRHIGSKNTDE